MWCGACESQATEKLAQACLLPSELGKAFTAGTGEQPSYCFSEGKCLFYSICYLTLCDHCLWPLLPGGKIS